MARGEPQMSLSCLKISKFMNLNALTSDTTWGTTLKKSRKKVIVDDDSRSLSDIIDELLIQKKRLNDVLKKT